MQKGSVKITRVKGLLDLFNPPKVHLYHFFTLFTHHWNLLAHSHELGIISYQPNHLFPSTIQHFRNKFGTYLTFALPYFFPISFLRGQYIHIKPGHSNWSIKIFWNIKNILPQQKISNIKTRILKKNYQHHNQTIKLSTNKYPIIRIWPKIRKSR